MEITREVLRDLRYEINDAIEDIAKRFDISLSVGNASFTPHNFTFKLKGEVNDAGDGRPAAAADWDRYRGRFDLNDVEFGSTFHARGIQYTICGIKPRSPKYPILAADPAGSVYKFRATAVRRELA